MTVRETILNHYKTALDTLEVLDDLKTVKVNKLDTRDLQDTKMPAAWIFSGAERRSEPKYAKNYWNWEINVQVWARNEDMEALFAKVHKAIHTEWQATEFAEVWYRKSSELWVVDSDQDLQGWSIIYTNFYVTDKGEV